MPTMPPAAEQSCRLTGLNEAADDTRWVSALTACCGSSEWVARILEQRPFADSQALFIASDAILAALDEAGVAEALAGHPRIGQRLVGAEGGWSQQEQAGVTSATGSVLGEIAVANAEYERRFGHVYLVCATGKSAEELLAICRARLANDPETEWHVVRSELAKITRIRLGKLLRPQEAS